MSLKTQKKLANDFFDQTTGIGYSLIRTNMNSCDFSSASYTYIKEGDADLKTFSIKPDLQFKIPLIKPSFLSLLEKSYLFKSFTSLNLNLNKLLIWNMISMVIILQLY